MITIICGTNRPNSMTQLIASYIREDLKGRTDKEVKLLDLHDIPHEAYTPSMYSSEAVHSEIVKVQEEMIFPADTFIIVSPEYNGSFPGVLKLFIDAISIHRYKENFQDKKAALVGVSSGRAGNLRGMEHLTGLLHYLGVDVKPFKLPISSIASHVDENQNLDQATKDALVDFYGRNGVVEK